MRRKNNLVTMPQQSEDDVAELHVVETTPMEFPRDMPVARIEYVPKKQRQYFLWVLSILQTAAIVGIAYLGLQVRNDLVTQVSSLRESSHNLALEVSNLQASVEVPHEEALTFMKIVFLRPQLDFDLAKDIARYSCKYSKIYNKDVDILLAIMYVESRFDPRAMSYAGAQGLMQLMPNWVKVFGIKESLFDVDTNIKYGTQVLSTYDAMYKNRHTSLAAYNKGPGVVDWELIKNKKVVSEYADNVLKAYSKLKKLTAS
jgi:hypothetical protein